ncbi:hypothetical protein [Sulfurisphaera ohwakuensis]|uniref:hypothetical protein n=1 Tax=Sulfurisphaera ohwakuensis TaxID=69656 RepID=UPI0036F1FC82
MAEYIAKYIISKNNRRIGEINIKYTANDDDESIKIAKSVCDKLEEEDVEEVIIEKIIGTGLGAVTGDLLNKSDDDNLKTIANTLISAFTGYIIDSVITKVIFSKQYPCIKPEPFENIVKYVDIKTLEEIVNEH